MVDAAVAEDRLVRTGDARFDPGVEALGVVLGVVVVLAAQGQTQPVVAVAAVVAPEKSALVAECEQVEVAVVVEVAGLKGSNRGRSPPVTMA